MIRAGLLAAILGAAAFVNAQTADSVAVGQLTAKQRQLNIDSFG